MPYQEHSGSGMYSSKTNGSSHDRFALINKHNLSYRHYTQSLISEALRVGLLPMETVDDVQMQIMGILEDLMREQKKATGTEPGEAAAKELLASIFHTIDTYLLAFHDPMYAITSVQSISMEEMFRGGRHQIKVLLCETISMQVQVKKSRISTENAAYLTTLDHEIHSALSDYQYKFAAHKLDFPMSYPLAETGIRTCVPGGISILREYLRRFFIENRILQLFEQEERDLLFRSYADMHKTTVKDMKVNLLDLVLTNAFGASILGKFTGILTLTDAEVDTLYHRLLRKTTRELEEMARESVRMLIEDFHLASRPQLPGTVSIHENDEIPYIRGFASVFSQKLVDARSSGRESGLFVPSDPKELFKR